MMIKFGPILAVLLAVTGAVEDVKQRLHVLPKVQSEIKNNTAEIDAIKRQYETMKLEMETLKSEIETFKCPQLEEDSEETPANVRIEGTERTFGSEVTFPCADGYYQCGEKASAMCQINRTWAVSGVSACTEKTFTIEKPEESTEYPFPCTLPVGSSISVTGTPTQFTQFKIYLLDDEENVVLGNGFRFNAVYDYKKVVVNTMVNSNWGHEYRAPTFPFVVGQECTIDIKRLVNGYKASVSGTELYDFERNGLPGPTKFEWRVDAEMKRIVVNYP